MAETKACRLLMLSCSQRKRPGAGLLPAIDRYDGPIYRVLRRYQRGFSTSNPQGNSLPDVYILSAKYGLISADQPIVDYERRMTAQRADELRPRVLADLHDLLRTNTSYQVIFFCMGREYWQVFQGWDASYRPMLSVVKAEGSMGGKQAQLHDWLHGAPPASPAAVHDGVARIRGVEVDLTTQQVLEVARRALRSDRKNAARFHSWYVPIDGQRVAPKWLVSQLTGLMVNGNSDSALVPSRAISHSGLPGTVVVGL